MSALSFNTIGEVSHIIQLAVAPAFLLTAIASMMTVMINRLARLIDRARLLEGRLEHGPNENIALLHAEGDVLAYERRHGAERTVPRHRPRRVEPSAPAPSTAKSPA
jgi:hypothetical protein